MKIAIDCFKLIKGVGKSSGIYNLTVHLVKNLAIYLTKLPDKHQLMVLGNDINKEDFATETNINYISVKGYSCKSKLSLIKWELWGSQSMAKNLGADIVIYPRGFCGLTHRVKDIVIIHDMIPFFYKNNYPGVLGRLENAYITNRLVASAKGSSKVITISEYSKKDIIKYSKVASEKITVINNGYNDIVCEKKNEGYIATITTALPHKNAVGIVKAYGEYIASCKKKNIEPMPLKIIGITENDFERISQKESVKLTEEVMEKIVFEGFVKESKTVHQIIANSSIFLFLSLYEGFGFPPLEAMQLGVPVICSNATSLPEVTDDAAVLVEPKDYEGIGNEILKLSQDVALQKVLVEKGYENVKRFDWEKIAKLYFDAIQRVYDV